MKEYPGYYSVLPGSIRYDKRISASAKILYSELTALASKHGYCYATNAYFARLYGVSNVTISRQLNELKKTGAIRIEIDVAKGNERKIYITEIISNIKEGYYPEDEEVDANMLRPPANYVMRGHNENVKQNITSSNNKSNNIKNTHKDNILRDNYNRREGNGQCEPQKPGSLGVWFENIWKLLPADKRRYKAECLKFLQKLKPDDSIRAKIESYVKRYPQVQALYEAQGRFFPQMQDFIRVLKNRRYLDDLPDPKELAKNSKAQDSQEYMYFRQEDVDRAISEGKNAKLIRR